MSLKTAFQAIFLLITGSFVFGMSLSAGSLKYPVDISFFAADLKYSAKTGVKICEVQHGIYSTFKGDRFICGGNGNIPAHFLKIISSIPGPHWMNRGIMADEGIQNALLSHDFCKIDNLTQLMSDPVFRLNASLPLKDRNDISSYHGLIYLKQCDFKDIDYFRSDFPGVIVMDASGHDYWNDKYKMSLLFVKDPELAQFKPRWNLYPKKYSEDLAAEIINDLKCDRFVIKPRYAFRGNGVVIVEKESLDEMLYHIFHKRLELMQDEDICNRYWYRDRSKTFLVEEFVPADPVAVEHLDGRLYEPTVRIGFFLIYNKNSISVEYCGGYYRLPPKSLNELGTLNQRYKDLGAAPYFYKIDPEIYEKIKDELNIALPLLYKQMLNPD